MRFRTAYLTLDQAGYSRRMHATEVASMLGVAERTVRRWIRGEQQPDPCAWRLLEVLALGLLPWEGWSGFAVSPLDGKLWSPNGYGWFPGQLTHWGIEMQRLAHWRSIRAGVRDDAGDLRDPGAARPGSEWPAGSRR